MKEQRRRERGNEPKKLASFHLSSDGGKRFEGSFASDRNLDFLEDQRACNLRRQQVPRSVSFCWGEREKRREGGRWRAHRSQVAVGRSDGSQIRVRDAVVLQDLSENLDRDSVDGRVLEKACEVGVEEGRREREGGREGVSSTVEFPLSCP